MIKAQKEKNKIKLEEARKIVVFIMQKVTLEKD